MIRIGIVGIGFMGRIHYLGLQGVKGAKLGAVCSRDREKLAGDWTHTRGNFGPEPGRVDLTGVTTYMDYGAMLADPEIDLIDICNPTHMHPEFAIQALEAGKHVLVEKAIALTTAEADAMLAASKKAGKLLMVAHVLPFFGEFTYAAEVIQSKRYGKLVGAHFSRVISQPDWSADIGDAAKTGGPAVDLHIHDTHFIGLIAGVPEAVSSVGQVSGDAVNYLTTSYLYPAGGPTITCSSGAVSPGRAFMHGYEIYLEDATLSFSSAGIPLTVHENGGKTFQPDLSAMGDAISAFTREIQAAVDGIQAGQAPELLSAKLARDALVMCHKECESVKTGRVVKMD
ncbi:MAG: Gfo/Idh/MocA family protein [Fimbriiglobus sp.]